MRFRITSTVCAQVRRIAARYAARMHSRRRSVIGVMIATVLAAPLAFAGPEARVRVRGSARLEGAANSTESGFELRGTVLDDAGKAVSEARVRVRLLGRDGSLRLLPRAEDCSAADGARADGPYRGGEEIYAATNPSGGFCLRWPEPLPDGVLKITFDEPGALLDPAELSVKVDRADALEVAFVPPPRTISLDEAQLTLTLQSRVRRGVPPSAQPLVIEWTRLGAPTTLLVRRDVRPGETHRVRLTPQELGGPGTGVLSATLGSGERLAEARAPVVLTATTELEAPSAVSATAAGSAELDVALRAKIGVVESGSVEALVDGRTVGIAPVVSGRARLPIRLPPRVGSVPVTLRYLPAAPWWLAGSPRQLEVRVPPASFWRRLPWIVGLLAALGWVVAAWRRPRRSERAEARAADARAERSAPEPAVLWSADSGSKAGWSGVVIDAHDRAAVAGAFLEVRFEDGTSLRAATSASGEFEIPAPSSAVRTGSLHVEAPLHSALARPLPPEGRLSIALVTRRRMLLARLVSWAERRGPPFSARPEPTPAQLAGAAERASRPDVSRWARAVEAAAFGPGNVGAQDETRVADLEPNALEESEARRE